MKFGEKYELLESLTTGGVETFVANDKVRGERVLVHILEGEAQKPKERSVDLTSRAPREKPRRRRRRGEAVSTHSAAGSCCW